MPKRSRKFENTMHPVPDRRNSSLKTRHLSNTVVHIHPEEYENLFRRLRYQLPRGLFHEAAGTLSAFIESKKTGDCDFANFKHAEELPLALADSIDPMTLQLLEKVDIRFIKDLEKLDAEEKLARAKVGLKRRVALELAINKLKNDFWRWRGKAKGVKRVGPA
ncbi:hypothetical protein ACYFX5_08885 [Bremerella sp. T1]|uniref:hypothetical protein n=1 Tax=Bremerella sp. TYQ1 TaxID=3119568 RepID=UPI001CCD1193|nr:hypothetical protein [Bremerella volcania]UBM38369.1 hypothetical protein LA756_10815 [Bremerella volcania]